MHEKSLPRMKREGFFIGVLKGGAEARGAQKEIRDGANTVSVKTIPGGTNI
jgi:hypothetical protein